VRDSQEACSNRMPRHEHSRLLPEAGPHVQYTTQAQATRRTLLTLVSIWYAGFRLAGPEQSSETTLVSSGCCCWRSFTATSAAVSSLFAATRMRSCLWMGMASTMPSTELNNAFNWSVLNCTSMPLYTLHSSLRAVLQPHRSFVCGLREGLILLLWLWHQSSWERTENTIKIADDLRRLNGCVQFYVDSLLTSRALFVATREFDGNKKQN
jgi:hypothetical protein